MRSKFSKVRALLPTQKPHTPTQILKRQPKASANSNLEEGSIDSSMDGDKPITVADIEKATNVSLADPALLEEIDKLFELSIGEDVALP